MKGAEELQRETIETDATGLEIAIIGMAGKFPGASNIEEFWDNLKNGVESIGFFSEEELEEAGIEPGQMNNPAYVKECSIMERADYFDATFFGYTPGKRGSCRPRCEFFTAASGKHWRMPGLHRIPMTAASVCMPVHHPVPIGKY